MKILHIAYSCIPGQFRGGVSKVVYDLGRAQALLGHEVSIYTTNYNSSVRVGVPLDIPIVSDGVKIHYFKIDNARWVTSSTLRHYLITSAPFYDVLHSHNIFLALNFYACQAHKHSGRPLFYHVHGSLDPLVLKRGFFKCIKKRAYLWLIEKRNYECSTGLFALSISEAEQIRRQGITKPIHLATNGIWSEEYATVKTESVLREQWGLRDSQPIVLFIGRIVPKKGVHLLVNAFADLHHSHPDAVLMIGGDRGQDTGYVRLIDRLVADHGLNRSVIWTGFLSENEKRSALGAATIFSHVSESEGMAMSVLEAMAAGLPVIVSKACYMSDAVGADAVIECGFSAQALAATLNKLLTSDQRRQDLGVKAQQYVRSNHSWLSIAKSVVATYQTARPTIGPCYNKIAQNLRSGETRLD